MTETSAAMAVLDIGDRVDEDNDMELETELLRRDIGAGFKEVNARIDELRRETAERINELRRETTEGINELRRATTEGINEVRRDTTARIDEFRRETTVRIDIFIYESNKRMDRSDAQFRWLVGLMVTSLLATAGLFARSAHLL